MRFEMNSSAVSAGPDYLTRNGAWLRPAAGTLLVLAPTYLMPQLGVPLDLPAWLPLVGCVLGGVGTGLGAAMTNTLSAVVMRFVGFGLGIAVVVSALLR